MIIARVLFILLFFTMLFSFQDLLASLGHIPSLRQSFAFQHEFFQGGASLNRSHEENFSFFSKDKIFHYGHELQETKAKVCFVPFDLQESLLGHHKEGFFIFAKDPYFSFVLSSNVAFLRKFFHHRDNKKGPSFKESAETSFFRDSFSEKSSPRESSSGVFFFENCSSVTPSPRASFSAPLEFSPSSTWIPWGEGWRHETAQVHEKASGSKGVVVGPFSIIGPHVHLEPFVSIGPHCCLDHCYLGAETMLESHCVLRYTTTGQSVFIGTGCSLGQEGFGFLPIPTSFSSPLLEEFFSLYPLFLRENHQESFGFFHHLHGERNKQKNFSQDFTQGKTRPSFLPILHQGRVILGNYCVLGSHTCIHRGSFQDTVLEDHVYLDNLVHLGHNVFVGSHSIVAAQSGIAGSSFLGSGCLLGGQVGIAGHLTLGPQTHIAAQSGVAQSFPEGKKKLGGTPAMDHMSWKRLCLLNNQKITKKNSPLTSSKRV